MWVVRLAHPTVNRFRVIAEHTQEGAEKKAADQMRAWEAELKTAVAEFTAVQSWKSRAAKQLLSPEHRLRQMAEQLTAQAQEECASVGSLLRKGMLVEYTREWHRDHSPYPEPPPAEPSPEWYAPCLGFPARFIPSIRERTRLEAEGRFKAARAQWEMSRSEWEGRRKEWLSEQARRNAVVDEQENAYSACDPVIVAAVCRLILNTSPYSCFAASVPGIATCEPFTDSIVATEHPATFPRTFEMDYVPENRTLVLDYELPRREAIPSAKGYKHVAAGDKVVPVPAARASVEDTYDSVLYQVALRTIYELLRWDEADALDFVVFNGWVTSVDNATGRSVHPCVLTVQAAKREFLEINLAEVDPKACFRKLKGISAARLAGMSPVRPILQVSREDKRFIAARPVVDAIDSSTNLAAMDWEDFEQLIRDVFEKEFSTAGGEVKITRASRDHGVDAVAFDPDPIRGGKIVIQAKRYTDTVSVSAVRDLYGTILNEGANKGILVTTADYGSDAYEFAKGKPITLLNGSELLYLLQKHGRRARIDLPEARLLAIDKEKGQTGERG